MEMYLKYKCYKDWEIILYGSSLANYLYSELKDKDGYRCDNGDMGAHILRNKEKEFALTADILTSIKSPINGWLRRKKLKLKDTYEGSCE